MYNGINPIALQSQKWLEDTLLDMLQSKEYTKITIKDICKNADLTRQTFYQYFDAKNDLMRYCIKKKFWDASHVKETTTIDDLMPLFKDQIAKNRDFIQLLHINNLGHLFAEEISDLLAFIADKVDPDRDTNTRHIANTFLMAAIANSLLVWSQASDVTEDDYVDLLYQILEGKYYRIESN